MKLLRLMRREILRTAKVGSLRELFRLSLSPGAAERFKSTPGTLAACSTAAACCVACVVPFMGIPDRWWKLPIVAVVLSLFYYQWRIDRTLWRIIGPLDGPVDAGVPMERATWRADAVADGVADEQSGGPGNAPVMAAHAPTAEYRRDPPAPHIPIFGTVPVFGRVANCDDLTMVQVQIGRQAGFEPGDELMFGEGWFVTHVVACTPGLQLYDADTGMPLRDSRGSSQRSMTVTVFPALPSMPSTGLRVGLVRGWEI